jgi:site-specific recombinase XerD
MTGLAVKPLAEWPADNQCFYEDFCHWLRAGGYSDSTVYLYGIAARLALGWLDKDYRLINPEDDLNRLRQAIHDHYASEATCQTYLKGVAKLAEYLRFRRGWPAPQPQINWHYFLDPLPHWLAVDVRAYISFRQRNWLAEERYRATCTLLSHLTLSLRWMVERVALGSIEDLIPALWLDYVDARLEAGIQASTLNRELRDLQHFLRFLADEGRSICQRMLRIEPQKTGTRLPRDLSLDHLRRLLRQVEAEVASGQPGNQRQALLDRAWVLLMLHSGLRSGEVHRLRLSDLDTSASLPSASLGTGSAGLEARRVRIEQSKGLKDRMVCLSVEAAEAIRAYLEVRGPAASDHVFLYRHQPLNSTYCRKRLRTLDTHSDARATPHQLRCSCATLLLNAGASVLTVQALLGHKHVDTTLRYARVYDSTVPTIRRRQKTGKAGPTWQEMLSPQCTAADVSEVDGCPTSTSDRMGNATTHVVAVSTAGKQGTLLSNIAVRECRCLLESE